MLSILLQRLPFFMIIGLGYGAGRSGFFPEVATAWLTKFVVAGTELVKEEAAEGGPGLIFRNRSISTAVAGP